MNEKLVCTLIQCSKIKSGKDKQLILMSSLDQVAMKMKRLELVEETFAAEKDPLGKKQLAYILGQQVSLNPLFSCVPSSLQHHGFECQKDVGKQQRHQMRLKKSNPGKVSRFNCQDVPQAHDSEHTAEMQKTRSWTSSQM